MKMRIQQIGELSKPTNTRSEQTKKDRNSIDPDEQTIKESQKADLRSTVSDLSKKQFRAESESSDSKVHFSKIRENAMQQMQSPETN
jgi:hypothetical protein